MVYLFSLCGVGSLWLGKPKREWVADTPLSKKPAGKSTPNCIVLTYLLVSSHPLRISGSRGPWEEDRHTWHEHWWAVAHGWTCHKANWWNTSLCMPCKTDRNTPLCVLSNQHLLADTHPWRATKLQCRWNRRKDANNLLAWDIYVTPIFGLNSFWKFSLFRSELAQRENTLWWTVWCLFKWGLVLMIHNA